MIVLPLQMRLARFFCTSFPCIPDISTSLVGSTWGTLSNGAGASVVAACFFLRPDCLFPPCAIFSLFSVAFFKGAFSVLEGACGAEFDPFELSGGADALEDDKRRWWPGRGKGCGVAPRTAGRAKAHTEGGGRALEERMTLPAAEENMAGDRCCGCAMSEPACRSAQGLRVPSARTPGVLPKEPHRRMPQALTLDCMTFPFKSSV